MYAKYIFFLFFFPNTGLLLHFISQESAETIDPTIENYGNILQMHLNSKSALQRMIAALVINEWAHKTSNLNVIPNVLKIRLQQILLESIYYDEIAMPYTKILQDTKDYISVLKEYVPLESDVCNKVSNFEFPSIFNLIVSLFTRFSLSGITN